MNQTTSPAYVPGVCNINRAEIAYRKKVGHIGLAATVIVLAVLIILSVNKYYRVVVFMPALLAASGYLQAKNKFCVGYGGAGKQNAEEGSAAASSVTDTSAVAKDKAKSRIINLQSFGIALLVTVVAILIPQF